MLETMLAGLHPMARAIATAAGVAGALVCHDPILLAVAWLGVLVPLLAWNRILVPHLRFFTAIVLPIALALLFVWGWVVGAAPGQPIQSSPSAGFHFAALTALRLVAIGAVWQLCFLTLATRQLVSTLRSWGARGQSLAVILGTFSLLPELSIRARQVLEARFARGLVQGHGWAARARQFPFLLPALMAWVLRSALQRGELWQHRGLIERMGSVPMDSAPPWSILSSVVTLAAVGWVSWNLWQLGL